MRWTRSIVVASALCAGALSVGATLAVPVGARQTATPTPILPDPAECRVEPRSAAEVAALLATPVARDFEDRADAVSPEEGEPLDAQTLASVTALVRQLLACGNAGDWPRFLALTTDHFLQVEALGLPLDQSEPPPPEEQVVLVAVRDGRRLPDGRVVVAVVTAPRLDPEDLLVTVVILIRDDGRWLIDDDIDSAEAEAAPGLATPAPVG
jgi:hypothetical protein